MNKRFQHQLDAPARVYEAISTLAQCASEGDFQPSLALRASVRGDAAEADVRGGALRLTFAATAGQVTGAVQIAAQKGAAALHAFGDRRLARVETAGGS